MKILRFLITVTLVACKTAAPTSETLDGVGSGNTGDLQTELMQELPNRGDVLGFLKDFEKYESYVAELMTEALGSGEESLVFNQIANREPCYIDTARGIQARAFYNRDSYIVTFCEQFFFADRTANIETDTKFKVKLLLHELTHYVFHRLKVEISGEEQVVSYLESLFEILFVEFTAGNSGSETYISHLNMMRVQFNRHLKSRQFKKTGYISSLPWEQVPLFADSPTPKVWIVPDLEDADLPGLFWAQVIKQKIDESGVATLESHAVEDCNFWGDGGVYWVDEFSDALTYFGDDYSSYCLTSDNLSPAAKDFFTRMKFEYSIFFGSDWVERGSGAWVVKIQP